MLHKQIVFAAIAVTALMGLIVPLTAVQAAQAQVDTQGIIDDAIAGVFGDGDGGDDGGDDGGTEQGDDSQNLEQTAENEAEVENEIDQENDQSQENNQANVIETGPNTATVSQSNSEQSVAAAADAESGDAEAEAEDEDHNKGKKSHYAYSDSTTADADSIATATAEATGIQSNEAAIAQDSSADDNVQVNENEFGDQTNTQVAVPITDIDQTAENRGANIDIDEEYGNVDDGGDGGGGDDGLDIDPAVLACLQLPPGQIRACIDAL